MKVLCPSCERLVDLERFSLEDATLIITCQRCGVATRIDAQPARPVAAPDAPRPQLLPRPPRVALSSEGASNVLVLRSASHEAVQRAAQAAQGDPFHVPDDRCPRCISPRTTGSNCPKCGLAWDGFDPSTLAPPTWLAQEWLSLLTDWGNEARHVGLRERALGSEALAAVGRLYQLRLADSPDDPVANHGLAEVLRVTAAVSLQPQPTAVGQAGTSRVLLFVALVVLAGLAALIYGLRSS